MDTLATRTLSYPDENGTERDLVLTIFMPSKSKHEDWEGGVAFGPPLDQTVVPVVGADLLQAVLGSLTVARGTLEGTDLFGRARWQGMVDCGLPWHAEKPSSSGQANIPPESHGGEADVLTTRALTYADESGHAQDLLLTVFMPFGAEDGTWKCGFTLGPPLDLTLRHGVGADFIEALLACLAIARAALEGRGLGGHLHWDGMPCCGLPYQIGRSFWLDPVV